MDSKRFSENLMPGVIIDEECKCSAVLMPLINIDGKMHLLFEKRSMKLEGQPGDVCFPGGMIEDGETPVQAAIRECCEELLISEDQIRIIGPSPIFHNLSLSTFPFVAEIRDYNGAFNADEVSEVFAVPLKFFMETAPEKHVLEWKVQESDTFPYERIQGGKNYRWRKLLNPELFYDWHGTTIWGFTAKILYYSLIKYAVEEYGLATDL